MRLSLTLLFAAAVAVVAQDTVSVTTGSDCEPHGDHWHCPDGIPEPTTPPTPEQLASHSAEEAAAATASITLFTSSSTIVTDPTASSSSHSHDDDNDDDDDDDHDHAVTASTCEAHDDHWHCPSGVAEPTTPPPTEGQTVSSTAASTTAASATTASESQAPQQTENAAARIGAGQVVALVGAAAYFL